MFENVTAAILLAEKMLRSTETVEEFNAKLATSSRPGPDGRNDWLPHHYSQAKNAIAENGDGLGKDSVKHFLPRQALLGNETLQNAINSYYGERRQAAAHEPS